MQFKSCFLCYIKSWLRQGVLKKDNDKILSGIESQFALKYIKIFETKIILKLFSFLDLLNTCIYYYFLV